MAAALASAEAQLQDEIRKAVQNAKNEFDAAVQAGKMLLAQLNEAKRAATATWPEGRGLFGAAA